MSWDLYVLPLAAGEDPVEALERREEAEPGPPDPELVETVQAHHDDGVPIEATVDGDCVSVNVPYWDLREQSDSVTARLTALVAAVVERTGWSVYDPQAGRVITVEELPRLFVQEQSEGAAQVEALVPPEKHRKRLFGMF